MIQNVDVSRLLTRMEGHWNSRNQSTMDQTSWVYVILGQSCHPGRLSRMRGANMLHECVRLTEKSADNSDEDGQNGHIAYAICVFPFLLILQTLSLLLSIP